MNPSTNVDTPAQSVGYRVRPSHELPGEIFDAILALEDQVRLVEQLGTGHPDFLREAVTTGARRDDLAALLLRAGVTR